MKTLLIITRWVKSHQLVVLWLAGLFANGIGWMFTLLANRTLSLEEMGTFGFYVSLITISSILSVSLEISVNRYQAAGQRQTNILYQMTRLLHYGFLVGIAYFVGFLLLASASGKIDLSSPFSLVVVGSLFLMIYPLSWARSMLQARELFLFVSLSLFVEGMVKLVVGWLAYIGQKDLFWFLLAMPISALSAFLLSWRFFRKKFSDFRLKRSLSLPVTVKKFFLQTVLMRVGLIALLSLDMIVAKWALEPEEAGVYALVSLVGKMIYFANQSFYSLLTPAISPWLHNTAKRRRAFLSLMISTLVLSGGIVAFLMLLPQFSLGLLLGERYVLVLPYTVPYALASVMVSLLFMLSLYDLLRERFWISFSLLGALLVEILLMALFHASILQIVENVIWAAGIGLFWVMMGGVRRIGRDQIRPRS